MFGSAHNSNHGSGGGKNNNGVGKLSTGSAGKPITATMGMSAFVTSQHKKPEGFGQMTRTDTYQVKMTYSGNIAGGIGSGLSGKSSGPSKRADRQYKPF
jgi:hypothetical protein